ncbi:DoxX family protein [Leptospira wolffii]|uniref:DoxX family protein n=1 Tax=Leptospira wolffii TaxID=409998 RepID=UPI0002D62514|nr:DoxX family protein [Leptospira wolffii]EPG65858.1 DoxX-like family protein [Leptospira wolffii serovar Khorat str. Khorat-H2]
MSEKKERIKKIAYWIITSLISLNYLYAGIIYIIKNDQVISGMGQLGYPLYFITILGIWKILGAVVLIAPRLPLLKEWAYAGILFNLTAAAASNAISGFEIPHIITPLVMLVFAAFSWWSRPADRKLAGILS